MKGLVIILFFASSFAFSQELKFEEKKPLDADHFVGIDSYQNLYFLKDQVLHKQGDQGNYVFNNYQLGSITSVDIINPLKILVFYRDVNTILFLDNRLTEIERINFNNFSEFINISAASNAGNNQLWVFNIDSQQLELFNYRTERKTLVSQPFTGDIRSMVSNFNFCYILTQESLFTFNIYGSLISENNMAHYHRIVQQGENVVAVQGDALFYIPSSEGEGLENAVTPLNLNITEITIKDLQGTQDFLYIYDGNSVHTFSLTKPKQ